ncbi:MAG: hypothetical protein E7613_05660 [Ruminococcaceae bacterium]|nr:hypothetical protein [Oscillospiraceae bacterium]
MLDKLLKKSHFYTAFVILLLILAMIISVTNFQVAGAVIFGVIAALSLVLFSDLTMFLAPTLLLSVFVTECYDSYSTFIKFIPLAIPLAGAIIFHLVKYKIKIKPGKSLPGLIAVAIAVTLGGIGTISASDYFSPKSLFYMFMLGGGMILLYLLFTARFNSESGIRIAILMYAVGILASFMICLFYARNWEAFKASYRFLAYQPSNNLSTFLMLAMPFPMFFARTRHVDVIATLFMYVCTALSSSRAGLLMGSVEIIVIFVAYTFFYEKKIAKKLFYITLFVVGVCAFLKLLPHLVIKLSSRSLVSMKNNIDSITLEQCLETLKKYFISPNEPRMRAIKQGIEDFISNPIFGTGIGYTGNTHVYSPVSGAMNWYHLWTAQIFGGLGIVGILAYGYQLIARVKIYLQNRSPLNMTLFMSYIGLWLMSQLNPGEFCPIPYAMMAVIYFAVMERKENEDT